MFECNVVKTDVCTHCQKCNMSLDSAAEEFQLLSVFPFFDIYSIKTSFFPIRPLGVLKLSAWQPERLNDETNNISILS